MPDAGATGRRVARAQRQVLPSEEDVVRRGTVTAVTLDGTRFKVSVDIDLEGEIPGIYCLASYASPLVGDYVVVVGREGSWTCLGQLDASEWGTYTPDLTATTSDPSLGSDGSFQRIGLYRPEGGLVHGQVSLRFGTTAPSAGSGTYLVSSPTPMAARSTYAPIGSGYVFDSSAGDLSLVTVRRRTGTNDQMELLYTGTSSIVVTNSTPWTWAANDIIGLHFAYEPA